MSEDLRTVRLGQALDYRLIGIQSGLKRHEIDSLVEVNPFIYTGVTRDDFRWMSGGLTGWPYGNVISETDDLTVFGFASAMFDAERGNHLHKLAIEIANVLGAVFEKEPLLL